MLVSGSCLGKSGKTNMRHGLVSLSIMLILSFEDVSLAMSVNESDDLNHSSQAIAISNEDYDQWFEAAKNGDKPTLELLLNKGIDPNIQDSVGRTALVFAVDTKNSGIVRLLMKHKADPNIPNQRGQTALMWASGNGYLDMVQLLLEHGANPNIQDRFDQTAMILSINHCGNPNVIKLLLEYGANPNLRNSRNQTALIYAVIKENFPVAKLLLEHEADPNIQDQFGQTALMRAAANNENNRRVNSQNANDMGQMVLEWIIACDRLSMIKLLLAHNANPNIQDNIGQTALMFASDTDKAKLLLKRGANPNLKDNEGRTILIRAAMAGHADVVQFLLSLRPSNNQILNLIWIGKNQLRANNYIINQHSHLVNVNEIDNKGRSALIYATEKCNKDSIELLLKCGANPNSEDQNGRTPLMNVIDRRAPCDITYVLIDEGADPRRPNKNGVTALEYASKKMQYGTVSGIFQSIMKKSCRN